MKCPVCNNHEQYVELSFQSDGFDDNVITCRFCGTAWTINLGFAEIVVDPQDVSSLSATTECVDGAEYSFAA